MNNIDFRQLLQFGADGEHLIANFLMHSSSMLVIPYYQFNNLTTAPKAFDSNRTYTAPDLICYSSKGPVLIEVKTKRKWVRFNDSLETGIDANDYEQYKSLSNTYHVPCKIFFLHLQDSPSGLFSVNIDNTNTRHWSGKTPQGKYIQEPMVFWKSESLSRIPISDIEFHNWTRTLSSN